MSRWRRPLTRVREAFAGGGGFARRRWRWFVVPVLVFAALVAAADVFLDEPLRRQMERRLNDRLQGYTVTLHELDFHVIGFSLDLLDLMIRQQANPEPPVAHLHQLTASVEWRQLLRGRVVSDFFLGRPKVYIDRRHLESEAKDEVPVEDRGWQDALQAIYPFEINRFRVADGDLVYVESGQARPLHLSRINIQARNIRNIRSRERTYPSDVVLEAVVFDSGTLRLDGQADFLATPHLGVKARLDLARVTLDYLRPVAARYNVTIKQGTLSATGLLEYAPTFKQLHLTDVQLHGLQADYVHTPRTAAAERQVRGKVAEAAREAQNAPGLLIRVDRARADGMTVGYVNKAAKPAYRVFLQDADLTLENLSNQQTEGTAGAVLRGKFMGSGVTVAKATFRPEKSGPDFDLDVRIENTQMRAMNDLFRAYGNFDVVSGVFSFYSELRVKDRWIEGYVKPLFRDMDVYDKRQDREKSAFRKLYERVVGGLANLLENRPRDEVATKTQVSGRVDDPKTSTGQAVLNLIQNAFFQAILPGFEREVRRLGT